MEKDYRIIQNEALSHEMEEPRFIIINPDTGEILDNNNGWGYRNEINARRAYEYKLSESDDSNESLEVSEGEIEKAKDFYREHRDLYQALINVSPFPPDMYTTLNDDGTESISIHDIDDKTRESFSLGVVKRLLVEYGYDKEISAEAIYQAYNKYE